jgi:hypothetical protein
MNKTLTSCNIDFIPGILINPDLAKKFGKLLVFCFFLAIYTRKTCLPADA